MLKYVFILVLLWLKVVQQRGANPCPNGDPGLQCSSDCKHLGICDASNIWHYGYTCPDGQVCKDEECNSIAECDQELDNKIICKDLNVKIPDLENCQIYYNCKTDTQNYLGEEQICLSGRFNACSGKCTNDGACPSYTGCSNSNGPNIVTDNKKLAYICVNIGSPTATDYLIIWETCPNGYFKIVNNQLVCTAEAYSCENGNGVGDDDCPSFGRHPIAGTNCSFRECYSDGTNKEIKCLDGYKYDDTLKKCVTGLCV